MSKSLYVKITEGVSIGPYSIYYDMVQPSKYAFLYGTTINATNIPLSGLTTGDGIRVTIPDTATSVILQNANGECLNYKTYSIVEFDSVTSTCTGYYNGTATINIAISGDNDQYQYSKDGGATYSASTSNKTYSFTNVSNGSYTIAVKNVSDGVVSFYGGNPLVINCAPVFSATYLTECVLTPPPSEQLVGTITISATGGSGSYKYALKNIATGVFTPKQTSNVFTNLNGTGQYGIYAYDAGNTVTPDYELSVGTTTFNCPAIPDPLTFTTTTGCGPTGYPGTGIVTASNFAGGSNVYMYIVIGITEADVRYFLTQPSDRIALNGATSYTWNNQANRSSYYIALQDSASRITVVQTSAVSCTVVEPANKQFLAYSLATNSCDKTGLGTRYWTYDTGLADGYYRVNGSSTVLKFETTTNISQRGTYINSIVSQPCVPSSVTLTPGVTDFGANAYLLFVNNVAYQTFKTGTNTYPAGSVVKLSFNAGGEVCGVRLNGQPYTSNTNVTLAANTNYNFVINAENTYAPQGSVYCEANQSKQLYVNACGTQDIRIVTPCSTACTSTTYTETCSGAYNKDVLRTFKYVCNGLPTGQTTTYTCGPCSSTVQDWQVQSYTCVTGDCNLRRVEVQANPCAAGYNTTRTINTNTPNCQCGGGCSGTSVTTICSGTTQVVTTTEVCTGDVVSVVNVPCSTSCGANTAEQWTNSGAIQCYGTCVKKQKQIQTNPCASANNYGAERFVDVGGATCDCGESCQGQETYNFCTGTTLYTVQRYKCPPKTYIGTPQIVETCSTTCGASTAPLWEDDGVPACGSGLNSCNLYQRQVNVNPCSSATVQYVNLGPSNSCGPWEWVYYCVNYGVAPYERRRYEQNYCTGNTRNNQLVAYNSVDCGYVPPLESFPISNDGGTPSGACGSAIENFAYCEGGTPDVGVRVLTAGTGGSPYPNGVYHVFLDSWIEISGSNGYITDKGTC